MLKINMLRMALMNQAQTVSGMRGRVMPLARRSRTLTAKLIDVRSAARQKRETLAVQRVNPALTEMKKDTVIPRNESAVVQNEIRLSRGNATSQAPICAGRK